MFADIKAIIFDLDDTLYLQAAYKKSGFTSVAKWLQDNLGMDYIESMNCLYQILKEYGPSYQYMFNRLCCVLHIDQKYVKDLVKVFLDHEPEIYCFEGVTSLLQKLRHKYKLGLLTDGREETQRKKVRCLRIESHFDVILYSDSMGLEKPAAELYQFFEQYFSLPHHMFCYVGDNPHKDFIEAKKRGWLTIRVRCGEFESVKASTTHASKLCISSVVDLKNLF